MMNNQTTNDETIERYREGLMTPAEREEFERRIESDEKLRRSVRIDEAMTMAIAIDRSAAPNRHAEMRARAIDAISRIAPATPAVAPSVVSDPVETERRSHRPRGLYLAGLVVLLVGVGGWFFWPSGTQTSPAAPAVSSPAATMEAPATSPATAAPAAESPAVIESKDDQGAVKSMRGAAKESDAASARPARRNSSPSAKSAAGSATEKSGAKAAEPAKADRKPPVFKDPTAKAPIVLEPNR